MPDVHINEPSWNARLVLDEVASILGVEKEGLDRHPRGSFIAEMVRLMDRDGHNPDDPVRATTARIGDKWCTLILMLLRSGSLRSTPLRRLVSTIAGLEISTKVMSEKLRTLERDGFVTRTMSSAAPPQVTYDLTDLGGRLADRVTDLVMWVTNAVPEIQRARRDFDEQHHR